MKILLEIIEMLHTTPMGADRIRKNLSLETADPVKWCIDLIKSDNALIEKKGKNYYITAKNCVITVNAGSFTIITAHKSKSF